MIEYDENVKKFFCSNDFVGELDVSEPDVLSGRAGTFGSGDVVQFFLRVDKNQKIKEVKFKAHGSCATIASANYIAGEILNRHIKDLKEISWQSICEALHLPDVRRHSALLVIDALSRCLSQLVS